jgi:hypothetical protein
MDDHAGTYLDGNTVTSRREEERQGARGRFYAFASPEGTKHYSLLLIQDGSRIVGLFAQGEAAAFARSEGVLDEMVKSLSLERVELYNEVRDPKFRFSLRLPPSWTQSRRFGGGRTLLVQYTSPPVAADRSGQTVHASLTLTVEHLEGDAGLESFYAATRQRLGSSFELLAHDSWKDGYSDVMTAETPMAVSRVKRFYRVAERRGYSLAFEAREDAYFRVSRWLDLIASTLEVGSEID